MVRPTGSGSGLSVIASVRLTKSEAAELRARYGSLTRGLRHALDLQRRSVQPPKRYPSSPSTPAPTTSTTPQEKEPTP